jgi:hypothetical protein
MIIGAAVAFVIFALFLETISSWPKEH